MFGAALDISSRFLFLTGGQSVWCLSGQRPLTLVSLHKDTEANNLAAKCKLGFAALELAPDVIEKLPLDKLILNMSMLIKAKIPLTLMIWMVLVVKVCWSHIGSERFEKLVQVLRPWLLADDPEEPPDDGP